MIDLKNKNAGFTLIETIIVVMLILLIMTLGINTYRNQQRHVVYNEAVFEVLTMVKTARNHALTNRPIFDEEQTLSVIPKNGYGVYFERSENPGESRVVLFANTAAETALEKFQFDPDEHIEQEFFLDETVDFVGMWADLNAPDHTPIGGEEAVLIFSLPLEEALLTLNNMPADVESMTRFQDLYLEFRLAESPNDTPSQYIHINSLSGLAEVIKP